LTGDLQEPEVENAAAGNGATARAAPDLDEVRERLKARGLLTDAPAVVIPKEPRAAQPAAADEVAIPEEPHWAESPYDAWDVTPGPDTTVVPCPRCGKPRTVPVEATRLVCEDCDRAWRYVICSRCDRLQLAIERQESWQCHHCAQFSRAWWRTPSARMLALPVLARRRDAIVQEQRRIVREGMRMRRWKLIAFGVVAALAAAVFVVATRAAEPNVSTGRAVACPHFRSILEDVAAGRITDAQLQAELEELQVEVAGEPSEFGTAVADMLAAEAPTSPGFIAARAALVDACGPDLGTG
jgi:hypothetical protein